MKKIAFVAAVSCLLVTVEARAGVGKAAAEEEVSAV